MVEMGAVFIFIGMSVAASVLALRALGFVR
jgi:hypothetical protein